MPQVFIFCVFQCRVSYLCTPVTWLSFCVTTPSVLVRVLITTSASVFLFTFSNHIRLTANFLNNVCHVRLLLFIWPSQSFLFSPYTLIVVIFAISCSHFLSEILLRGDMTCADISLHVVQLSYFASMQDGRHAICI